LKGVMMQKPIITFIGAGHMGSALVRGLIADGYPTKNIWLTDPLLEKIEPLQREFGVNVTVHNEEAAAKAEVILLAVKPQIMAEIAKGLASLLAVHKPLIMSIAAGIRETNLQQWLGKNIPIVRIMSNTPALIRAGASGLFANPYVTPKHHELAEMIMRSVGITVWLKDEKMLDAVTALSGSGPAYFFLIIEAMQQAGIAMGLSSEVSQLLTLQTAYGAARMALESSHSAKALRQHVTSPGGTTEEALRIFEQGGLRQLIENALEAAKARSEELGK
jgi:pyrroline-5-carboxylate reductase